MIDFGRAMARIPVDQYRLIKLKGEGRTTKEIATILAQPENRAEHGLQKAVDKMRGYLKGGYPK